MKHSKIYFLSAILTRSGVGWHSETKLAFRRSQSASAKKDLVLLHAVLYRIHLARTISFASTSKAAQILSLCQQDPSFGPRLQTLFLSWPDTSIYRTRRKAVLTADDFCNLLPAFPAMRDLELVCLPFPSLDSIQHATLASTHALQNLRSLTFTNSSYLQRKEGFKTIAILLSLSPLLRHLNFTNIPLDIPETLDMPSPIFRLHTLSIKLTVSRMINMQTLSWMLSSTIEAGSCQQLTVHISTCITDRNDYASPPKPTLGFSGLDLQLAPLGPSLHRLSLLGLRESQASHIISKTSGALTQLELFDTFGLSPELLSDLPYPTSLSNLAFRILPSHYGPVKEAEDHLHPEVPISSASFLQELGKGGKLERLKTIIVPDNARFAKRGRWINNMTAKACRRNGVWIDETPVPKFE